MPNERKPLLCHPACERDYKSMPENVQDDAGHNLDRVQQGLDPQVSFGPLHSLGSGVMELKINEDTDTYRVVYVAKFSEAVFVLDSIKKKSPTGKRIPRNIENRIKDRYRDAEAENERLAQQNA